MKDVNEKESLEEQIISEAVAEIVAKVIKKEGYAGIKKLRDEMLKDCKVMEPVRHFNAVSKELEEAYRQKAAGPVFIDEFLDVPDTNVGDTISRADVEQTIEDNILCYTHSDRPIDQDPDTECHMAIRTALRMLRKDMRKLPPAGPQIIRCKDCKYREHYRESGYICVLDTGDPYITGRNAEDDDWFCADAERKEATE